MRERVTLRLESFLQLFDGAKGEALGLGACARDEGFRFVERHFFAGVVGLAECVGESFDEVDATAREDHWRAVNQGESDKRRPAGVRAEAKGCVIHEILRGNLSYAKSKFLNAFDGEGDCVAAAETQGGDATLQVAALQFVKQRDEDARAGCADGMAERDGAAVYVHFFRIEF